MQNSNSHTFRRFLNGSALASVMALSLAGCLVQEDDKDEAASGGGFSFTTQAEVVNHTAPEGGEPGTLVVESSEYTCWDDEDEVLPAPVFSTSRDTSLYAIEEGKLYVWNYDECWATVHTGTSATLQGTWTANTTNVTKIPVAYRSDACVQEYTACEAEDWCEDSYNDDEGFLDIAGVTTISDETFQSTFSGRFCMASVFVGGFIGEDSDLSGLETLSSECTSVQVRNTTADKIATFSSAGSGTTQTLTFKYNDATCTMDMHFGLIDEDTQCAEADGDMDSEAFAECVYGSGFYVGVDLFSVDDFALGKQSSEKVRSALDILKGGVSPFTR